MDPLAIICVWLVWPTVRRTVLFCLWSFLRTTMLLVPKPSSSLTIIYLVQLVNQLQEQFNQFDATSTWPYFRSNRFNGNQRNLSIYKLLLVQTCAYTNFDQLVTYLFYSVQSDTRTVKRSDGRIWFTQNQCIMDETDIEFLDVSISRIFWSTNQASVSSLDQASASNGQTAGDKQMHHWRNRGGIVGRFNRSNLLVNKSTKPASLHWTIIHQVVGALTAFLIVEWQVDLVGNRSIGFR